MMTLPSRREVKEGLSKKDKKKLGKEKIRDKRRANAAAPRGGGGSEADVDDDGDGGGDGGGGRVQGVAAKVTTLSAATAAQNLAVFLKNYSDWTRLSLLDESSSSTTTTTSGDGGRRREIAELLDRTIREAQHLYESALHVRSSILPPHHPDVIATKYSLAELLDSPPAAAATTTTTGAAAATATSLDGDRANRLREEILSAYNVEEREEDGSTSE